MQRPFAFLLVLLVAPAGATAQAQPAPAVDYARLLDARFFPQQGRFMFGTPKKDILLFPPPGLDPYDVDGAYVVRDASGAVVVEEPLGSMQATNAPAFMTIGTRGGSDWGGALAGGGAFTYEVVLDGDVIGAVPFTVTSSGSDDPFNPGTTFVVDGPWRTHAYFQHETDRPDYILHFNAWVAPDDMASNTVSEVSIRRNGEEVAWGSTHVDLSYGWGRAEYRLLTPGSRPAPDGRRPNPNNFTIQDVTPGTYEILLSDADGNVFRRFTVEAGSGTFPAHARSDVNHAREGFLTPRRIGGSSLNKQFSVYWVVDA